MPDSPNIDVAQLACEDVPQAKFPGAQNREFRVHFAKEVHAGIASHAAEDTSVEIGGALVGLWQRDADGPFVMVSQFIRCNAASSKSIEVTFTHEAWNEINREMDSKYADLKVVGWYHSHPGFGIFLSDRDRFIHEHFFSNPGQIAYVVDPIGGSEGVFAWKGGKTVVWPNYWIGDRIMVAPDSVAAEPIKPGRAAAGKSLSTPGELDLFLASLRKVPMYVLVFLVGFLLANWWGSARSAWEQQRIIEGVVAHYGVYKAIRPGLREVLSENAAELERLTGKVNALADEHVELAGEEAEAKKAEWDEVRGELSTVQRQLTEVGTVYGLNERETAVLERFMTASLAGASPALQPREAGEPDKKK